MLMFLAPRAVKSSFDEAVSSPPKPNMHFTLTEGGFGEAVSSLPKPNMHFTLTEGRFGEAWPSVLNMVERRPAV